MNAVIFHILGLPVTAYALAMAFSLAVSLAFASFCARREGIYPKAADTFLLAAIPLCLLMARLAYVLVRLPFFLERPDGLAFRLWQGGYTLWGAMAGFLLAGHLTAKISCLSAPGLLDAMAPAGLLFLALGRFCEGLAGQGFGEEAALGFHFFPFAVRNVWGEWRWAVFMLEGLAAIAFVVIVLRKKSFRRGSKVHLALVLVCAFQILFESFREDEFLRWGFVRSGQLIPAVILFGMLIMSLYAKKTNRWHAPRHLAVAGFLLLAALVAALEFALDKTALNICLIYGLMLAAVVSMYALVRKAAAGG